MRNEAPFTDLEGRESAVKASVAVFSFTGSASTSDMVSTGLGLCVDLPWRERSSGIQSEDKVRYIWPVAGTRLSSIEDSKSK